MMESSSNFLGGLTRCLSFTQIDATLSTVDEAVRHRLENLPETKFDRSIRQFRPEELFETSPAPGGSHLRRMFAYAPTSKPDSSILMTNLADGWSSLSWFLSKYMQRCQIQVMSSAERAVYPSHRFTVYRDGQESRTVMAMKDFDRWVFFQKGPPESFEESELYKRRMIRERLDRQIITRYLSKVGCDVQSSDFWTPHGEALYYCEEAIN